MPRQSRESKTRKTKSWDLHGAGTWGIYTDGFCTGLLEVRTPRLQWPGIFFGIPNRLEADATPQTSRPPGLRYRRLEADVPGAAVWARIGTPHLAPCTPHPALDTSLVDTHVRKGQGVPAYSIFEGTTDDGTGFRDALAAAGVTAVDVAGIATDYCVRASALDAVEAGFSVRVLTDLIAGVAEESSAAALEELEFAGIELVSTKESA